MAIARKVGSGILFALTIITFLVCVVGVVGSWFAKVMVDQAAVAAIDMVSGYMGLASQTITGIDGGLADAEQTVGTVQSGIEGLRTEGLDSPVGQVIERTVSEDLMPRLSRLESGATTLHSGLVGFNQALGQINRVPLVNLPSFNAELEALDARIGEAGAQARELRAAIEQLDGSRLLTLTERVDARIGTARATLATAQTRLAATQATLETVKGKVSFWTTVAAAALTFLLILFAAGQASLAAHAWGWMRA